MRNIVLLPVGSIEEHGVLPLDTDTLIAQAFCVLAARKLQADVQPPISEGFCPTTCKLAGTKTLRFLEVYQSICDRLQELIAQDQNDIILVNIHGGNEAVLTAVVQDLYQENRCPLFYFNPYTAFAGELDALFFSGRDNSFKECSLLHASLEILEMARLPGPDVDEDMGRDSLTERLKKRGVLGFSYREPPQHIAWRAGATAQKGNRFLEATAERFIPVSKDFQEYVESELEKEK
jgi:creatinine amidohydrolase/Fe(II)-dependent formamide hydrolase-like protein